MQINQILAEKAGIDAAKEKVKESTKLDPNSPYLDSLPADVNLLQTDPKTNGNRAVTNKLPRKMEQNSS